MKGNLLDEKVETLFETLKKRYRKNTKVQCPAFENEPIHVNTTFWKHLKCQNKDNYSYYRIIFNNICDFSMFYLSTYQNKTL